MPIYEYECDKCGHAFEREQKISDAPIKTCPECRSRRVTKLISRTSFVLKGGGWYADGYADKKAAKDEAKTSPAPASAEAAPAADAAKTETSKTDEGKKTKGTAGPSKKKGSSKQSAA